MKVFWFWLALLAGAAIAPPQATSATEALAPSLAFDSMDIPLPDEPLGIKGCTDPWRKAFTLIWEPVTRRVDGSPLTNLAGYNVYRRTAPEGSATKINSYLVPIPVFADRVNGQTFTYSVRAVDTAGNESKDSLLVDSSPDLNIIFLAEDGRSCVTLPGRLGDLLRPAHNKYGVSLTIRLKEESSPGPSIVVRSIALQFLRGDTKEEVKDLAFNSPAAIVKVGYNVVNGQVAYGAPGAQARSLESFVNGTPDQLSLFWFNGVAWVKLGGEVNAQGGTVNIASSVLGRFQLRMAAGATSLSLDRANVFPALFTPNGDGFNDRVYFVLENPNNSPVGGKIFSPSGRYVTTLPPPAQSMGVGTTLIWSGTDSSGSVVPGGLYLYRIEGEDQVITGTIAVAQ
ncbi:MAG: hypothetical protein LHV69_06220 [Elusimicrobia bacterium]|nr:hypothetical protein [Candidatus Obscuribacterium magneticum]